LFRILFNLMSNAVAVASRKPGSLNCVAIDVAAEPPMVMLRLADDGPGLPAAVRIGLFGTRSPRASVPRHGYRPLIARDLAERNAARLTLAPAAQGTTFVLRLPAFLSVLAPERHPRLAQAPAQAACPPRLRSRPDRAAAKGAMCR